MPTLASRASSSTRCGSGPRRPAPDDRLCRLIGEIVAAAHGVSARELRSPGRGSAAAAFARQTAIYLGHVVLGLSLTRLGRGFVRDRATVRHACRTVEERRDDASVERMLGMLERMCADLAVVVAEPDATARRRP